MDSMGAVFDALGSPVRRRILDIVKNHPGCTVGRVAAGFDTTRIAVMRHIRILEEAHLLVSEKVGRKRLLHHNAVPIQMIYDRWTTEYSSLWASRMADVKYRVEGSTGKKGQRKGKRHGRHTPAGVEGRHQGSNRGRVA
jgi:DNA-binding transcriptional ArsR family regulator